MERKDSNNEKNMKNQNFENKKIKNPTTKKTHKDKYLPWWVELLFVQIGLPDKYLIKILKANKKFKDLIKNDKNTIIKFFLILFVFVYIYPIVKQSKNKLECESAAKLYITKNKNIVNINRKNLKMLSTNFCNGGDELNLIKNIKK